MLETLANLAQVLSAAAVVAGIAFGLAQVRQFRQQRRDALALELMRSIQDNDFTRSLRLLLEVPEGTSATELRALGAAVEEAAWLLAARYETLGYLVYCGSMPFQLVEQLLGGVGVHLWERLQPWVEDTRRRNSQPLMLEWFQWLAEQLQRRERPAAVPAYERCASWRP